MVDDDEKLCQLIQRGLGVQGYAIDVSHDGVEGLEKLAKTSYDLIILDIMMPHLNGFKTLKYIRDFSDTPILMLTGRGDEMDELIGLRSGADDYLQKPCSLHILTARIDALLRRVPKKMHHDIEKVLNIGTLSINLAAKEVTKNGLRLKLTKSEFEILYYLVCNKNRTCSKEDICKEGLNKPYLKNQRSIDTHINNLREKLQLIEEDSLSIINFYAVGYKLQCK